MNKAEKGILLFACSCIVLGTIGMTVSIIRGRRYGK